MDDPPTSKRGRDANLLRRRLYGDQQGDVNDIYAIEFVNPPLVAHFPTKQVITAEHAASTSDEVILYTIHNGYSMLIEGYAPTEGGRINGDIIVTTKRIIFASLEEIELVPPDENATSSYPTTCYDSTTAENANVPPVFSKHDFMIDIHYIILHALANDPEPSLYCQLDEVFGEQNYQDNDDDEAIAVPTQFYFFPPHENAIECEIAKGKKEDLIEDTGKTETKELQARQQSVLSELFSALTTAVELNPIASDDEDEYGNGTLSGEMYCSSNIDSFFASRNGGRRVTRNVYKDDEDDSAEGATEEERAAMLARLDAMLIVPPELERNEDDDDDDGQEAHANEERTNRYVEGQFDDADEDDDGDCGDRKALDGLHTALPSIGNQRDAEDDNDSCL